MKKLLLFIYLIFISYFSFSQNSLPTAQMITKRSIVVKDAGYNATTFPIYVITEGAELINNADTVMISSNGSSISVYSDGSAWHVY